MSREIKFRMWDFENKEMIDGDSLAFEEYAPISHLLSQKGIMQYTGLKDKKESEIYESDILLISIFNYATGHQVVQKTVPVEYRDCKFGVEWSDGFTGLDGFSNTTFEVIGNIYANPELLGEDKQ